MSPKPSPSFPDFAQYLQEQLQSWTLLLFGQRLESTWSGELSSWRTPPVVWPEPGMGTSDKPGTARNATGRHTSVRAKTARWPRRRSPRQLIGTVRFLAGMRSATPRPRRNAGPPMAGTFGLSSLRPLATLARSIPIVVADPDLGIRPGEVWVVKDETKGWRLRP